QPLAADFIKFETDIKATGLDFLSAASDIKSDAPTESLSLNFSKISFDYKEQGNDLLNLSTDFADFVKINGISESKVGESFIKISIETATVSSLELNLGADFQKISSDLLPPEGKGFGGGPLTLEQAAVKFAGDFIKLAQDLKAAGGAFTALGADTIKLT